MGGGGDAGLNDLFCLPFLNTGKLFGGKVILDMSWTVT